MEILNNKTVKWSSMRRPIISVYGRSGLFSISQNGAKRLGCQPGDSVSFVANENKLFVRKDNENGFLIRPKARTGGQFSNRAIANKLIGNSLDTKRFLVAVGEEIEGVMYHELIPIT